MSFFRGVSDIMSFKTSSEVIVSRAPSGVFTTDQSITLEACGKSPEMIPTFVHFTPSLSTIRIRQLESLFASRVIDR